MEHASIRAGLSIKRTVSVCVILLLGLNWSVLYESIFEPMFAAIVWWICAKCDNITEVFWVDMSSLHGWVPHWLTLAKTICDWDVLTTGKWLLVPWERPLVPYDPQKKTWTWLFKTKSDQLWIDLEAQFVRSVRVLYVIHNFCGQGVRSRIRIPTKMVVKCVVNLVADLPSRRRYGTFTGDTVFSSWSGIAMTQVPE